MVVVVVLMEGAAEAVGGEGEDPSKKAQRYACFQITY